MMRMKAQQSKRDATVFVGWLESNFFYRHQWTSFVSTMNESGISRDHKRATNPVVPHMHPL